ncbi:hypothetical protein ACS5NO_17785 [Larkinella sp. GY13]|uniref:hypothetical protein n=1 Tax=Larkinella sp. GY13 TaxID=3453720 RepID=UPI003EEB00B5
MRLLKLQAVFLFYRTFWVFSNLVSMGLIGVSLLKIVEYFPLFLVYFLWFKLLSEVAVWYLVRKNYQPRFWFYHNLGLSETVLFAGAFVIDLLIAFLLIGLAYQLMRIL